MAEQEIIKHGKKAYSVWGKKEYSFWHKLKDFVLEIAIIVFAISLSLWFHNRSEHNHQQKEVKAFLLGLRQDLKADIQEMEEDKQGYFHQKAAFSYINGRKLNEELVPDSVYGYYRYIFNIVALNPNNGRFEGFKSSGKLGNIENMALQNDILDLYQENIPALLNSTTAYNLRKSHLFEYLQENNRRLTDSTSNMLDVLKSEPVHNRSAILTVTEEITGRYSAAQEKMRKIIAAIDAEYGVAH